MYSLHRKISLVAATRRGNVQFTRDDQSGCSDPSQQCTVYTVRSVWLQRPVAAMYSLHRKISLVAATRRSNVQFTRYDQSGCSDPSRQCTVYTGRSVWLHRPVAAMYSLHGTISLVAATRRSNVQFTRYDQSGCSDPSRQCTVYTGRSVWLQRPVAAMYSLHGTISLVAATRRGNVQFTRDDQSGCSDPSRQCTVYTGRSVWLQRPVAAMYSLHGTISLVAATRRGNVQFTRDDQFGCSDPSRQCTVYTGRSVWLHRPVAAMYSLHGTISLVAATRRGNVQFTRDDQSGCSDPSRQCTVYTGRSVWLLRPVAAMYSLHGTISLVAATRRGNVQFTRDDQSGCSDPSRQCTVYTGRSVWLQRPVVAMYSLHGTISLVAATRRGNVQFTRDDQSGCSDPSRQCTVYTGRSVWLQRPVAAMYSLHGTIGLVAATRRGNVQFTRDDQSGCSYPSRQCTVYTGRSVWLQRPVAAMYSLHGTISLVAATRRGNVQFTRDDQSGCSDPSRQCTVYTGRSVWLQRPVAAMYSLHGTISLVAATRRGNVQFTRDDQSGCSDPSRQCTVYTGRSVWLHATVLVRRSDEVASLKHNAPAGFGPFWSLFLVDIPLLVCSCCC